MTTTFLGASLAASFPIMPNRTATDLLTEAALVLLSLIVLPFAYKALPSTRIDRIAFAALVVNRLLSVTDSLMVLFLDQYATAFLQYFSLSRSLLRYLCYLGVLAFLTYRRLTAAAPLVLRDSTAATSYGLLVVVFGLLILGCITVISFFSAGVIAKVTGDDFLHKYPRATTRDLSLQIQRNTPIWPAYAWQLTIAVAVPLTFVLHIACDVFFYVVASGLWTSTYLNVARLTPGRWISLAWSSVLALVLHLNFILFTVLARTVFPSGGLYESLGFTLELAMAATTFDYFVFYVRTTPMLEGVEVLAVIMPSTRGIGSSGQIPSSAGSSATHGPAAGSYGKPSPPGSRSAPNNAPASAVSQGRGERVIAVYQKTYTPPTARAGTPGSGSRGPNRNPRRSIYLDANAAAAFPYQHSSSASNLSSRPLTPGLPPPLPLSPLPPTWRGGGAADGGPPPPRNLISSRSAPQMHAGYPLQQRQLQQQPSGYATALPGPSQDQRRRPSHQRQPSDVPPPLRGAASAPTLHLGVGPGGTHPIPSPLSSPLPSPLPTAAAGGDPWTTEAAAQSQRRQMRARQSQWGLQDREHAAAAEIAEDQQMRRMQRAHEEREIADWIHQQEAMERSAAAPGASGGDRAW
ncbi:hypothetical protein BC828DRAFT_386618 [Blastocladiella britannica]|nr:hypothetical protein BC828DRAFT_386618 [Blastocladiella britannica]